jgi:hypothetical protein
VEQLKSQVAGLKDQVKKDQTDIATLQDDARLTREQFRTLRLQMENSGYKPTGETAPASAAPVESPTPAAEKPAASASLAGSGSPEAPVSSGSPSGSPTTAASSSPAPKTATSSSRAKTEASPSPAPKKH